MREVDSQPTWPACSLLVCVTARTDTLADTTTLPSRSRQHGVPASSGKMEVLEGGLPLLLGNRGIYLASKPELHFTEGKRRVRDGMLPRGHSIFYQQHRLPVCVSVSVFGVGVGAALAGLCVGVRGVLYL